MLNDFTWNMTGYIPKHAVNPYGDGIIPYVAERIFQLEPEPPAVSNPNEHILSALQEKNLLSAPLRTAAQQAHQILSRRGWRRFV
jgi:hypothetical protein